MAKVIIAALGAALLLLLVLQFYDDRDTVSERQNTPNALAIKSVRNNDHISALLFAQKGLIFAQENFPADHPDALISLSNLAAVYAVVGHKDAEVTLNDALAKTSRVLGPDSLYALSGMNNLAYFYIAKGDVEKARSVINDARRRAQNLSATAASDDGSTTIVYFGTDPSGRPAIDCSNFNSNVGPFNPDPETGGDMAQCGPFGTAPTFGMWNDWGQPGLPDPGGGGNGGGGGGGNGDDDDDDEDDDDGTSVCTGPPGSDCWDACSAGEAYAEDICDTVSTPSGAGPADFMDGLRGSKRDYCAALNSCIGNGSCEIDSECFDNAYTDYQSRNRAALDAP